MLQINCLKEPTKSKFVAMIPRRATPATTKNDRVCFFGSTYQCTDGLFCHCDTEEHFKICLTEFCVLFNFGQLFNSVNNINTVL